ncbi:helix-turn-helix domain-containing protein [Marininema halotolerans]|uniref:HTH cro/C1-type domain-containing protein n=1 Tax=Marininema halotolerans TaxID=1155944 RepID=A0A1I6R5X2_9BACL|nr:DUF4115 domain-containing protein [Marininema halotolerans]SFS60097.1 protein of unknown function [Marininema halotolerans]
MSAEIGHRLRQARESQGMNLQELEQRTGIPQAHLTAMEDGDFSDFPSPYYARVSLRTYSIAIGLDSRSILNQYRQSYRADGTFIGGAGTWMNASDSMSSSDRLSNQDRRNRMSMRRSEREGLKANDPSAGQPGSGARFPRREQRLSRQPLDEGRGTLPGEDSLSDEGTGELPRRVTLPKDLPDPYELGLNPSSEVAATEEEHSSLAPVATEGLRQRKGKYTLQRRSEAPNLKNKKKSSSFGKWYTRFLIVGAMLLIPATGYVVYDYYRADPPVPPAKQEQPSHEAPKDSGDQNSDDVGKPNLNPIDIGKGNVDQYELSNAGKIELKLKAKDECWIQLSDQEVGDSLKEAVLKKGQTFSYSYDKGMELWIELGRPQEIEMTVNGLGVKTSYGKKRKFRVIRLQ